MSQAADYDVANASGASVRSDINTILLAIASLNAGTAAPSTTYANMLWVDTTNSRLKKRNNANAAWIDLAPMDNLFDDRVGINSQSSGYTALAADRGKLIDFTTAGVTLAFTAAATLGADWFTHVRNSAASGVVTLDPNSTEQVDGSTTKLLAPGESCLVVCDGSGFKTVGRVDVNMLTEDTSPDGVNDFVRTYDASAAAHKKATPLNLVKGAILLSTLTASTSATLDFTGFDSAKYAAYLCVFDQYLPATDNSDLWFRVSTDAGSTFLTTSTYLYGQGAVSTASVGFIAGSAGDSKVIVASALANNATDGWSGSVLVTAGTGANGCKIDAQLTGYATTPVFRKVFTGGINTTAAINAIRFMQSSGNIASGKIRVYGIPL